MDTLPQKDNNINQKSIVTVIFAIIITFILFYLVYTLFISKDNFLLKKLEAPISTTSQINFSIDGSQGIITADQIDQLEQEIIQDGRLQQLEQHGVLPLDIQATGNPNPFKPFEVNKTIEETRDDLIFEDIEKPLPRVSN